jgi:hypothetical protein
MRFADLKNDFVFRRVFGKHPELTTALLNDLLAFEGSERIASLELLSPEQAPDVPGAKLSILDVKCRDQTGRMFVVEMQMLHVAGFVNRVVFNACRAYAGQLKKGQGYESLADVIALSICDFTVWPDDEQRARGEPIVPLVSRWSMSEHESGARGLGQVQYAFVELPKCPLEGPLETPAAQWAWYFRVGEFEGALPAGASDAQRAALALANEASFSAQEIEAYRRVFDEIDQARLLARDAERRGRAEGHAEGHAEGRASALREAIVDLCELLGISVSADKRATLARANGTELEALRDAIKRDTRWP